MIKDFHRSSDALHFVLFLPHGHNGWYLELTHVNPRIVNSDGSPSTTSKRSVCREFYAYHLHLRFGSSNTLLRGCRLLQGYIGVQMAKAENQRLQWLRHNQRTLRAELYNNLCDAIDRNDIRGPNREAWLGRDVILPPSFAGGPRDMPRRFLNAMAIVRRYHQPDLFTTITCNPN